jgi:lactate dehydrogenase-like 2-hydroxyacid dehydrogenase
VKPEILLLKPIYAPVQAQLEKEYSVRRLWEAGDRAAFLREACGSVRAVVTVGVNGMAREDIDALPKLELIACFGNLTGPMDFEATGKRGIAVTDTPDRVSEAVAELGAGMAVALMRRICEGDRFVRAGRWPASAPAAGATLVGKTCGIVGLGRIGREAAARLQAFGMAIRYQGPRRKEGVAHPYHADVESLAEASDCLVISCPFVPETRGLVDARVLDALGPEGFLVNVARGPIVNEAALIAALREKRIAGAALDVFWNEPQVPAALLEMDNVVLLPHVGSTTREIRDERGRKLMANLRAHFSGKPLPHAIKR